MEEIENLTQRNKMGLRPAGIELCARWYRFFCNQGFEAEILTSGSSAIIRLNGESPIVVVPIFHLEVFLVVHDDHSVTLDKGPSEYVRQMATDNGINEEVDLLVVGHKGLIVDAPAGHQYRDSSGALTCFVGLKSGGDWTGREWEMGLIIRCYLCKKIAVISALGSFEGRPCGHHEGDHYIEMLGREELQKMQNQWSWTSHVDRNFKRNGPEQHDLYRAYSGDGDLLYVGQSNDWPRRMGEHKRSSSWLYLARQITITGYESKAELDYAEKLAIRSEGPLFNIVHNR